MLSSVIQVSITNDTDANYSTDQASCSINAIVGGYFGDEAVRKHGRVTSIKGEGTVGHLAERQHSNATAP